VLNQPLQHVVFEVVKILFGLDLHPQCSMSIDERLVRTPLCTLGYFEAHPPSPAERMYHKDTKPIIGFMLDKPTKQGGLVVMEPGAQDGEMIRTKDLFDQFSVLGSDGVWKIMSPPNTDRIMELINRVVNDMHWDHASPDIVRKVYYGPGQKYVSVVVRDGPDEFCVKLWANLALSKQLPPDGESAESLIERLDRVIRYGPDAA